MKYSPLGPRTSSSVDDAGCTGAITHIKMLRIFAQPSLLR